MKTNIILLLLAAVALSSCSHFYRITTSNSFASDYYVLKVTDSTARVIPWEYRNELTPEVIREYSKVIPINSVTRLTKTPTTMSYIGSVIGGMFIGAGVGAILGYATYNPPPPPSDLYKTFDGLGAFYFTIYCAGFGSIVGSILGYILSPSKGDMLPIHKHLDELRKDVESNVRWTF